MACSRPGTMLYLEIKNGKEKTKTSKSKQDIGGTAVCMKRIMKGKRGCDQLLSNNILFADIWFHEVKTAKDTSNKGVYY